MRIGPNELNFFVGFGILYFLILFFDWFHFGRKKKNKRKKEQK